MKRRARLGFRWNRAQEKYVKREAKNPDAVPARVITLEHNAYPAVDEDVRVRSFAYAADLLTDTEVLVDTGCSRSMGSRQRADRAPGRRHREWLQRSIVVCWPSVALSDVPWRSLGQIIFYFKVCVPASLPGGGRERPEASL